MSFDIFKLIYNSVYTYLMSLCLCSFVQDLVSSFHKSIQQVLLLICKQKSFSPNSFIKLTVIINQFSIHPGLQNRSIKTGTFER